MKKEMLITQKGTNNNVTSNVILHATNIDLTIEN